MTLKVIARQEGNDHKNNVGHSLSYISISFQFTMRYYILQNCARNMGFIFFSSNRPCYLTTQAISEFVNNVLLNLETPLRVFCNLSKEFDQVNRDVLSTMVERWGVKGVYLAWFRPYLINRGQFVKLLAFQSEFDDSGFGVPRGSNIGPLLFLVYINDLDPNFPLSKSIFNAEDYSVVWRSTWWFQRKRFRVVTYASILVLM